MAKQLLFDDRARLKLARGVRQLAALHPDLMAREAKSPLRPSALAALALHDPFGFATYAAVSLAVRLRPGDSAFTRGR